MRDPVIWAVAMNAEHAQILRGLRRDGSTDRPAVELRTERKPVREIMADRPGHGHPSVGSHRSAMDYASDPQREADERFARAVLDRLSALRAENDFEMLAIFASRPMLGYLRRHLPPELAGRLLIERGKNLMHESLSDLSRIIAREVFAALRG